MKIQQGLSNQQEESFCRKSVSHRWLDAGRRGLLQHSCPAFIICIYLSICCWPLVEAKYRLHIKGLRKNCLSCIFLCNTVWWFQVRFLGLFPSSQSLHEIYLKIWDRAALFLLASLDTDLLMYFMKHSLSVKLDQLLLFFLFEIYFRLFPLCLQSVVKQLLSWLVQKFRNVYAKLFGFYFMY